MEVTERKDGVTVVNDAYNANPEAIRAALSALVTMARGRRAFAVLGPMSELGEQAEELHEQAGLAAAGAGLAGLIVVGQEAAPMLTGAKADPAWHGELLQVPDARGGGGRGRGAGQAGRRGPGQGLTRGEPAACGAGADRGAAAVRTILISAGVALVLALFGTPLAIKFFTRRGYGQEIREDGPAKHATKRGTPTMGGTVIVIATLVGYLVGHELTNDPMTTSGLLVLFLMTGLGAVGFIDDFIKIYKQRSLGLRSGAKLAGQAVVGAIFAVEVLHHPDGFDLTPADAHISFLRDVGPAIGVLPFVLWIVLMIAGWSNAVNLTDGLDGLATGGSDPGARRVRADRDLAAEERLHELPGPAVLPGARPAGPRGGGRHGARRLLRLPVVERAAGQDLHGRHRLARAGRRAGRAGRVHEDPAAAGDPRRPVRDHHHVGDHPGGVVQDDRAAGCSGWPRCSITSSCSAGPRPRS